MVEPGQVLIVHEQQSGASVGLRYVIGRHPSFFDAHWWLVLDLENGTTGMLHERELDPDVSDLDAVGSYYRSVARLIG